MNNIISVTVKIPEVSRQPRGTDTHIKFLSSLLREFTDHLSKYQLVKKNYASWRLIIVPAIKLIFCVNCRTDREAKMSRLQDYTELLDEGNSASHILL